LISSNKSKVQTWDFRSILAENKKPTSITEELQQNPRNWNDTISKAYSVPPIWSNQFFMITSVVTSLLTFTGGKAVGIVENTEVSLHEQGTTITTTYDATILMY
jgi:hypothetical protein